MHNTRVSQLKKYLANSFQLKYLCVRERERERERETESYPKYMDFFNNIQNLKLKNWFEMDLLYSFFFGKA